MSAYLFDSHAMLAFFQGEPGSDFVDGILRQSHQKSFDRFICMINLGEIIYLTKRRIPSPMLTVLLWPVPSTILPF